MNDELQSHLGRNGTVRPRRPWLIRAGMGAVAAAALLVAVIAVATNPPAAGERLPRQIPYRGVLEQNGAPVPSGTVSMLFELFNVPTGGTHLWADSYNVPVQDGQFSVALGDNAATPIPESVFLQPSLYLQVSVSNQQLSGRQRLLSAAYARGAEKAVRAENVDSVPPGAVMLFNLGACPAGWAPLDAARGRAIVGAGSVGSAVGAPLGDGENRGHQHNVDHTHGFGVWSHTPNITNTAGRGCCGYANTGYFVTDSSSDEVSGQEHNHLVDGTTAGASAPVSGFGYTSDVMPYLQLLVCQKQ